jgi:uncharacterized protein YbcV (DUF1398 family)
LRFDPLQPQRQALDRHHDGTLRRPQGGPHRGDRARRSGGANDQGIRIWPRSARVPSEPQSWRLSAFYTAGVFTLEQITDIHDRSGAKETLGDYLRALRDIGVKTYDSYLTDGHSEYFGADGQTLIGPAFHEVLVVAQTCEPEQFLQYMRRVDQGGVGYEEMSRTLANHGVERWTFDTDKLTVTYRDKAGVVLLTEGVE